MLLRFGAWLGAGQHRCSASAPASKSSARVRGWWQVMGGTASGAYRSAYQAADGFPPAGCATYQSAPYQVNHASAGSNQGPSWAQKLAGVSEDLGGSHPVPSPSGAMRPSAASVTKNTRALSRGPMDWPDRVCRAEGSAVIHRRPVPLPARALSAKSPRPGSPLGGGQPPAATYWPGRYTGCQAQQVTRRAGRLRRTGRTHPAIRGQLRCRPWRQKER